MCFVGHDPTKKIDDAEQADVDIQAERNAALLDFLMEPEEDGGPLFLKLRT
jgi:hypothetical protein